MEWHRKRLNWSDWQKLRLIPYNYTYNIALKQQMFTAVQVEPGVLTYFAVANESDPAQITILEI